MNYLGMTIQARIYPDLEDYPEGTVRWWIEPHNIEVIGRYYLLQDVDSDDDFPVVTMGDEVINLHHALILHGVEAYQPPIPFAGHIPFFESFTEEAERDFPVIRAQQQRYIKALEERNCEPRG